MDIDARAFGQLEGKVEALTLAMAEQNKVLEQQNKTLADISSTLSQAKGGWKTLLWLAGTSATAAGAVTWALQHLMFKVGS